jgi:hypothetical protein
MRHRVLVMTALIACFASTSADACKCAREAFSEQVARADVIVLARIVSVEDPVTPAQYDQFAAMSDAEIEALEDTDTLDWDLRLTYAPLIVVKGDASLEPTVRTGRGGGDCGTPFVPSQTALLFISKDGFVSMCGGTREYAVRSCAALQPIESLARQVSVGSILPDFELPGEPALLYDEDIGGQPVRYRGPAYCADGVPLR